MAQFNAKMVYGSFAKVENEKEVSYDLDGLDKLIAELRTMAKDKRTEMKDILAEEKKASKEANAEIGKEFYSKLNVGEEFEILIGGKKTKVTKIATKSKTVGSAACSIVGWVNDGSMGKTSNRYLGFDKIVIDDRFEEKVEEPTLE